jgi:hypothetical protein
MSKPKRRGYLAIPDTTRGELTAKDFDAVQSRNDHLKAG